MKTFEQRSGSALLNKKAQKSFFSKDEKTGFFDKKDVPDSRFFNPLHRGIIQKKCASCEDEERKIQRQEQPGPVETKSASPDDATTVPVGRKPGLTKCTTDPRFPDFGCLGQQLKLDIDENLFDNAHQFARAATLFPGDKNAMLDTFIRYGLGKNLLETGFGFAGFDKKWSSRLAYTSGIALKTYDLLENGQLKLDVQIPIGKNVNLDLKLDLNTSPDNKAGEEKYNTSVGFSGRF